MFPDIVQKPVHAVIRWGEQNLSPRAKNAFHGILFALFIPQLGLKLLYRYFARALPQAMAGGEDRFTFLGLVGLVLLLAWLGSSMIVTFLVVLICFGAVVGYVFPPWLLTEARRVLRPKQPD